MFFPHVRTRYSYSFHSLSKRLSLIILNCEQTRLISIFFRIVWNVKHPNIYFATLVLFYFLFISSRVWPLRTIFLFPSAGRLMHMSKIILFYALLFRYLLENFLFSSSNSLSLIALNWEFVRTDTSVELNFCHWSHSSIFFFLLYFFLLIFWIIYNQIEFNIMNNKICMIENMLIPSHNLYNSWIVCSW